MKIGSALLLVAFIAFMWPHTKHMLTNSPKAEKGDWSGVIWPIAAVVGFVILLMSSV